MADVLEIRQDELPPTKYDPFLCTEDVLQLRRALMPLLYSYEKPLDDHEQVVIVATANFEDGRAIGVKNNLGPLSDLDRGFK
jgi:hypothetical protein